MTYKREYRDVLVGFERFSFTEEQLHQARDDLRWALEDLAACKKCNPGDLCRTRVNYKDYYPPGSTTPVPYHHPGGEYYMALDKTGCRLYGFPAFALHKCPGAARRSQDLARALEARYQEEPQSHLRGARD